MKMKTLFIKKSGEEFYRELDREERRRSVITIRERLSLSKVTSDPLELLKEKRYKRVVLAGDLSFKEIG
jgi:uncharacterized protein (DUF58 family)